MTNPWDKQRIYGDKRYKKPERPMSDMEAAWFEKYMEHGDATRAAREAGYSDKGQNACVKGSQLKKKFQKKIEENLQKLIKNDAVFARRIVLQVAATSKNDMARLNAAKDILDRSGYKAVEKKEISISDKTEEEIDQALRELGVNIGN